MDAERVPLLSCRTEERLLSRLTRAMGSPVIWAKVADASVLVLQAVGFGCSAYLVASPSPGSVCKPKANDLLHTVLGVCLQLLPILLMGVTLYASRVTRDADGTEQPLALSFLMSLCGIVLGGWMSVCIVGANTKLVVTIGCVVAAAAAFGFMWAGRRPSALAEE